MGFLEDWREAPEALPATSRCDVARSRALLARWASDSYELRFQIPLAIADDSEPAITELMLPSTWTLNATAAPRRRLLATSRAYGYRLITTQYQVLLPCPHIEFEAQNVRTVNHLRRCESDQRRPRS
jgi:hypothetical protein